MFFFHGISTRVQPGWVKKNIESNLGTILIVIYFGKVLIWRRNIKFLARKFSELIHL